MPTWQAIQGQYRDTAWRAIVDAFAASLGDLPCDYFAIMGYKRLRIDVTLANPTHINVFALLHRLRDLNKFINRLYLKSANGKLVLVCYTTFYRWRAA